MFVHLNLQSCVLPCVCSPWSFWTKGGVCLRVGSVGTSADASWQSTTRHRAETWTRLCPWLSEHPLYTADREGTRHDVSCGERNFIPTFVIKFSVEKDRKCHQDLWVVAGKKNKGSRNKVQGCGRCLRQNTCFQPVNNESVWGQQPACAVMLATQLCVHLTKETPPRHLLSFSSGFSQTLLRGFHAPKLKPWRSLLPLSCNVKIKSHKVLKWHLHWRMPAPMSDATTVAGALSHCSPSYGWS